MGMWGQSGREKRGQDLAQPCLLCNFLSCPFSETNVHFHCACLGVDGGLAHLAEAARPYSGPCTVLYTVGA